MTPGRDPWGRSGVLPAPVVRPDPTARYILSWLWLGILVVVAASLPGAAPVAVRYTLVVVLLYLALIHLDKLRPLTEALSAGLNGGT